MCYIPPHDTLLVVFLLWWWTVIRRRKQRCESTYEVYAYGMCD